MSILHALSYNKDKNSIFGTLAAFGLAHEEQGRKTLHAHTIIYIDLWNEILKALHSSQCSSRDAAPAEAHNIALVDSILKLLACDAVNTAICNSYLPQAEGSTNSKAQNRTKVVERKNKGWLIDLFVY
jgi:hypothetical protein